MARGKNKLSTIFMLVLYVGLSIYYINNSIHKINELNKKNSKGGQVMNTEMQVSAHMIKINENQKANNNKAKQEVLTPKKH